MTIGERIKARREQLGYSVEDVAKKLGKNRATVYRYESDYIENFPVSILEPIAEILETTPAYLMGWNTDSGEYDVFSLPQIKKVKTRRISMLGLVSCGEPKYSEEDFQYYVIAGAEVHADFALRANGDSMIGARINDGDIVFVRRQPDVEDGQIAVVLIDDDTLLKRVYKLPDGRIQLRAENPKYKPITIGGVKDVRTVRILGLAIAVQTDVI